MLVNRCGSIRLLMMQKTVSVVLILVAMVLIYHCHQVLVGNGHHSPIKDDLPDDIIDLPDDIIDFSHANNVTGFSSYIVPNVVHFVHFDSLQLSFVEVVTIRAAYLHQRPEKLFIHCNCHALNGKYWDMVKNIPVLEVRYLEKPTHVFHKKLRWVFHASDIARMLVLMEHGGIYLDSDSYVVKSLDYYRKFEMSIGWYPGDYLGTQVLVAHRNARFLKLWFNSYKYYRGERWYYNAGKLPAKMILERMPYLVHRVEHGFGVEYDNRFVTHMLYGVHSDQWKMFHCIHLLVRHKHYLVKDDPIVNFDEENIKTYNKTFGDMARLVLYGSTDQIL